MPVPPVDAFGIVYIIENAQQFWSELDDILRIPDYTTLSKLDGTLRRFISFCASFHELYLQSPLQVEHACDMILASELFAFHSERMCELMVEDAQTNSDPHYEMVLYCVMLAHGRRNASFLRSQKRWQPLLPLLMDHIRLDVDPDIDDHFYGSGAGSSSDGTRPVAVPIEAKLRSLSVKLLYEVCRVQKLSLQDLRIFDDTFIEYLFDLVEQTRDMHDETFNYSVIKLIVALNEQFMVASLQSHTPQPHPNGFAQQQAEPRGPEGTNRILRVLMSRVSSSPTFGENLIFMLNRADRTPEDLCMQLLVLKLLYLLFTTKGMTEYFYTNDLCVLVDVFLREIGDIDEDNESLRHTYLRVLHPLLTKTQLRSMPYKRPQIVRTLESLIENEKIRDVDPTTKRLVARCMGGDWCVQFRKTSPAPSPVDARKFTIYEDEIRRGESPGLDAVSAAPAPSSPVIPTMAKPALGRMDSFRGKNAKATRSAEHLPLPPPSPTTPAPPKQRTVSSQHAHPYAHHHDHARAGSGPHRHGSGDSSTSLPRVAAAAAASHPDAHRHRVRAGSFNVEPTTTSFSALSLAPAPSPLALSLPSPTSPRVLDQDAPLSDEPDGGAPPEIRVVSPTSPAARSPHPPSGHASPALSTASSRASLDSASSAASGSPGPRRRAAPPPPVSGKARRKPPAVPVKAATAAAGLGVSALAASSQPNLPALAAGKAGAY